MNKLFMLTAMAALLVPSFATASASPQSRTTRAEVTTERGTYSGERTVTRDEGTRTVDAQIVGPEGRSRSKSAEAHRIAPGEWEGERTVTGPNGQTRKQQGTVTMERNRR